MLTENKVELVSARSYVLYDARPPPATSVMKKIALTVLFLFTASLFGNALAAACAAQAREAAPASMQMQAPPSCCDDPACGAASCSNAMHEFGCAGDLGSVAVAQSSGAIVKAPTLAIVPVLTVPCSAHDVIARSKFSTVRAIGIARYAEVYARTGRLLI